jgi:hypothetical protein
MGNPRLLLAFTFALGLGLSAPSTAHAQAPANLPPAAAAAIDQTVLLTLDSGRTAAKAHPGGWYEAQVFAQQVDQAFQSGTPGRGKVDGGALVAEATGYIDAALKVSADHAAQLLAMKAVMLKDAGRIDEAKAVAKQAEDVYASAHGAKAAPPPPTSQGGTSAPATGAGSAAGASVSVTVSSKCAKLVALGAGATAADATPSELSPGAESTQTFAPGDVVWLFDKSGKAVGHAKVRPTTKTLTVGKSCKSVVAR